MVKRRKLVSSAGLALVAFSGCNTFRKSNRTETESSFSLCWVELLNFDDSSHGLNITFSNYNEELYTEEFLINGRESKNTPGGELQNFTKGNMSGLSKLVIEAQIDGLNESATEELTAEAISNSTGISIRITKHKNIEIFYTTNNTSCGYI